MEKTGFLHSSCTAQAGAGASASGAGDPNTHRPGAHKSRKIAVLDRETRATIATWPLGMTLANYPMALDQADHRLFVITRFRARLLGFDTSTGTPVQRLPPVGACDDGFDDQVAKRVYASAVQD